MRNNKGFTMIELLAAIMILGVLMIFAIPNVSKLIKKSKDDTLEANQKTLYMAAKSYYQTNTNELPKKDYVSSAPINYGESGGAALYDNPVIPTQNQGATVVIYSSELYNSNYLKNVLTSGSNQPCTSLNKDADSYVVVKRIGRNNYEYDVCIRCSGKTVCNLDPNSDSVKSLGAATFK